MRQAVADGVGRGYGDPRPGHRVPLGEDWALWRLAAVRSAGLPVSWLEPYALPAQHWDDRDDAVARSVSAAAVRHTVAQPEFVEAVVWQNPALVHHWLGRYAEQVRAGGEPALSRRDSREALVAFRAQRYCAKNETIGFFGPVAWARFTDDDGGLATWGSGGLRRRSLFVESWAVDAVAAAIADDPRLSDHLVARRHPACEVSGGVLRRPRRAPLPLDAAAAALLAALDRPCRVGELVDRCAGPGGTARSRAALDELRAAGVVLVGLPVPLGEGPEEHLRRLVADIPEPVLRAELLDRLRALDGPIEDVRAAAGDPVSLLGAVDRLDEAFTRCVGRSGHRDATEERYGRCVVYEDCRRDLDATIGADLLDPLRGPLSLLLDTARWFVAEAGEEVHRDLLARYRELGDRTAAGLPLCDLLVVAGDVLNGSPGTAVDRVAEDFTARWAELLSTATGTPQEMRTEVLRPLVRALFPAGRPAWRAARQHSPDLLLRMVPSPAGRRPQWVLGELHLALNTLENRPFVTQADDRRELFDATASDFADGRVVPVYPKDSPEVTSRTYPPPAMDLPDLYTYWSYTRDDGHAAVESPLPGAGLTVHDDGGRLVVRPASGGWQADVCEFLGEFLTALVVNRFQIRPPAAHLPRLLLDDVVIGRETWRMPASAVRLPEAGTGYRHAELRRQLVDRGMPRFLFAKVPGQAKPFLVDRDAPLSLRNLARLVRRAAVDAVPAGQMAAVQFVEMLPAPDELWLVDAQGRAFTSELRVVAVDGRDVGGELPVRAAPR